MDTQLTKLESAIQDIIFRTALVFQDIDAGVLESMLEKFDYINAAAKRNEPTLYENFGFPSAAYRELITTMIGFRKASIEFHAAVNKAMPDQD